MRILRCHVAGRWQEPRPGGTTLVDPSTELPVAEAGRGGIDFGAALDHARRRGGPALRALSLGARGELLLTLARALHARRDALIALCVETTGTTRKDAKFDLDGATHVLTHYGELGRALGERRWLAEGEGQQLGRSPRLWGQHVLLPLAGCAVHVNAFNFPVWGFAEKAACALLAGMPVVTKPATSTALVTEAAVETVLATGALPDGALSLICGPPGDLLERLGPQDVLAFTGAAATARQLRALPNLLDSSTRVNVEADSLNAAVLAADAAPGGETWGAFLRDVVREMTQKSGQKCTAVRRILVPRERLEEVQEEIVSRLDEVRVGNPRDEAVTMGPLATEAQLGDAVSGVALLADHARIVRGSGQRVDGRGAEPGRGFYLEPVLLRAESAPAESPVHHREVFGPVATLVPYDGAPEPAAQAVAAARGTLVTSLYSDDADFVLRFLEQSGSHTGRLYLGSEKVAAQLPGSGAALPQLLHGGPGRAGGGTELGGTAGLALYLQRVALSGDRPLIERLASASSAPR